MWNGTIASVDSFSAKVASLADQDAYAAAYVTFPAWTGACLIVGVAVPERGDGDRAKAVRDKFVSEVFPKVTLLSPTEPKERY